ncbi:MAG TPA: DUF47 family protein [Bryobacterales bacterium]|nr:DUF47 family protein [Bryobacterales bacterium]
MRADLFLFRNTRALERKIDRFYDNLTETAVVFRLAVRVYLKEGAVEEFEERLKRVSELETANDHLRREIERELYEHTLIPDSRGDVLGLIENSDQVLSEFESTLWAFANERPDIPREYRAGYRKLTGRVVKAADELGLGARAFFRSPQDVPAHNHKVLLYEKEADAVSSTLKREIFSAEDLDLCRKLQLKEFVERIDAVADTAEDVADRLAIYAIKRLV